MKIEYEATFQNIDKNETREKLKNIGAVLVRPEFLQKRIILDLPVGKQARGSFVRVRDEGDKVTLTLKVIDGTGIADQKETQTTVSDFDETVALMTGIGCIPLSYEETKRELWNYDGAEITIDEWPFLGQIVEVEGKSEEQVKTISEKLGFIWKDAYFGAIGMLYVNKYGLGPMDVAKKTGKLAKLMFGGDNIFI